MGFYIFTYFCITVFTLAGVYLIYRQAALPLHVRWEIYPVQHETTERTFYGGSYMEKVNWWKNKYETSRLNELKFMVPEILFLRGLWKENRSLWCISFPFHLGLYLMLAAFVLLLFQAFFTLWGSWVFAEGSVVETLLSGLIIVVGWIGMIAGTVGSMGMLLRRLTDRALRSYSTVTDYFNIIFILLFFLSALLTSLSDDPSLNGARDYVLGLLTAGTSRTAYVPGQSICGALTIMLGSLLIAYIPMTHMSHMFMKFFLYHNVKWDDVPNSRGGRIEAAVIKNLELKPTWQAKHVGADGQKSWKNIASSASGETK